MFIAKKKLGAASSLRLLPPPLDQVGRSFLTGNALIGLLVGFFLMFIAWNGVARLMEIQTSDRLGAKDPRESMQKM